MAQYHGSREVGMMRYWTRPFLLAFMLALAACRQNTSQVLPTLIASVTPIPPTTTALPTNATVIAIEPTTDTNAKPGGVRIVQAAMDTPTVNVYAGFKAIATN